MNVKNGVKLPKDIARGYENPWELFCTWTEDGKCMTPKYALQIVNKKDNHPVRLGKKSIRMELRKGDCHQKRKGSYNDCKATPPQRDMSLQTEMIFWERNGTHIQFICQKIIQK